MRRTLLLLALVALPACRTVYTRPNPSPSLDVAVTQIGNRPVALTLDDGSTRQARRLRLTDSTLVFAGSPSGLDYEVPRERILRLSTTKPGARIVNGVLLTGAGGAAGGYAGAHMEDCSNNTSTVCGLGGLMWGFLAGSVIANVLLNPKWVVVRYDASTARH